MQSTAINLLISKSIAHLKPTLQEKGLEAIWCLIENAEDFEGVAEAVWESIKSTNVKAASAGLTTIIHLIRWFGIQKFQIKKLLGAIESAVGSKQAAVRQGALSFYEECYKWIGDSIKGAVEKLNKPQQDELEKLFTQIKESGDGKPVPSRMTKAEQDRLKQQELDDIVAKEEAEEKEQNEAFDFAEEKDALASFDDAWSDRVLALKKWNEKKEEIEKFNAQVNTPKIKPHNNTKAAIKVLEKMLKDANMNVYDEAVKAIGYLAKGLKRNFHDEAIAMIGPILTNIKKRPNIIQNVSETLEAMLQSVDLEDVISTLMSSLKDKNSVIVKQA